MFYDIFGVCNVAHYFPGQCQELNPGLCILLVLANLVESLRECRFDASDTIAHGSTYWPRNICSTRGGDGSDGSGVGDDDGGDDDDDDECEGILWLRTWYVK